MRTMLPSVRLRRGERAVPRVMVISSRDYKQSRQEIYFVMYQGLDIVSAEILFTVTRETRDFSQVLASHLPIRRRYRRRGHVPKAPLRRQVPFRTRSSSRAIKPLNYHCTVHCLSVTVISPLHGSSFRSLPPFCILSRQRARARDLLSR